MSERDPRPADRTTSRATAQGDGDDQAPTSDGAGTTSTTAAASGATSGDALDAAPDPTADKSRGRKEPPDGSKTSMSNVR
jgi:hypothetical protein